MLEGVAIIIFRVPVSGYVFWTICTAKGRKLNNVTMTIEIDRKERMPTIEKSP